MDGITSELHEEEFAQLINNDGSRFLSLGLYDEVVSPGSGPLGEKSDYTKVDGQDEPPEYIPPIVSAERTWVEPAERP
jgi:hypothetical protein